ncbi:Hypothetical predicted protein, partial [Paramuricea clavata]
SGVSSASVTSSGSEHISLVDYVHSVIIDCSSFSFVDSMAVTTLSQIAQEFERQSVKLYLVNYSYQILKVLKTGNICDDNQGIFIFPTISEALQHAYERRHKQIVYFMEDEDETQV